MCAVSVQTSQKKTRIVDVHQAKDTVISMTRQIAENSGVHSSTENVKPLHVLVKAALVATATRELPSHLKKKDNRKAKVTVLSSHTDIWRGGV